MMTEPSLEMGLMHLTDEEDSTFAAGHGSPSQLVQGPVADRNNFHQALGDVFEAVSRLLHSNAHLPSHPRAVEVLSNER